MAKKQKVTIIEKQYYFWQKKYRETLSFLEVLELRAFFYKVSLI